MTASRPSVFIGSSSEGLAIARAIQVNLDHACEVVLWSQGVFGLSGGTLETLVSRLDTFDFAILVLSADDMMESRGESKNTPRDNVLLEMGMFIGKLGRDRTYAIYDRTSTIKIPSDLAGITLATYQPHSDSNLQAALGAATTQIQDAINSRGRRIRDNESTVVTQDTQFQVIHGLLDASAEQFMILMHEANVKLQRSKSLFDPGSRYEFWKKDNSGGQGGFSVEKFCNQLADAGLLTSDLRNQISLSERGREYARWLIERGHKATFFESPLGAWGERPSHFGTHMFDAMEQQHREMFNEVNDNNPMDRSGGSTAS